MAKRNENPVFAGADEIEEENLSHGKAYEDIEDGVPLTSMMLADTSPPPPEVPKPGEKPEPEEEPEAEAEAEPEPEPEAKAEPEHEEGAVPSWRLAQEASRRRQAEARVQEMEAYLRDLEVFKQHASTPGTAAAADVSQQLDLQFDFGDNARQMFDKALDGDLDTANKLFGEMLTGAARKAAEAAIAQSGARRKPANLDKEIQQRLLAMRLQEEEERVIHTLETNYDVFNPQSTSFSKDMVDEVLTIQDAYIAKHHTPAEAMDRAAAMVLQQYGIQLKNAAAAAKPGTSQRSAAVQRNLKANAQQPPTVPAGGGGQQPEIDISRLTEEEFDALPDAVIARLRGDFV